jgi:hypothetical protein
MAGGTLAACFVTRGEAAGDDADAGDSRPLSACCLRLVRRWSAVSLLRSRQPRLRGVLQASLARGVGGRGATCRGKGGQQAL